MDLPPTKNSQSRLLQIKLPMPLDVKEAIIRAAQKDGQEDAGAWAVAELVKILKKKKELP